MNRIHIASCVVLVMASLSCTTGDPTRGGIFWSESKAKARQAELMQEMQQRSQLTQQEESTAKSLSAMRQKLLTEQRELKSISGYSPAEEAQRQEKIQQIQKLRREIDAISNADHSL